MGERYDASKPTKYINYLDANNLYGWAMSKPLPTHGFKWMDMGEIENLRNYSCILEVDLEYPRSLHDWHNDYPLAPEQIKVNKVIYLLFIYSLILIVSCMKYKRKIFIRILART